MTSPAFSNPRPARPHYRLRCVRHNGRLSWQVQHVAGVKRDYIVYATSYYRDSGAAVNAAAGIPLPRDKVK
jgi:hypothetical protein